MNRKPKVNWISLISKVLMVVGFVVMCIFQLYAIYRAAVDCYFM